MLTLPRDLSRSVQEQFTLLHGGEATALARACGRVNLIGEHLDYLGGRCVPIAVPYATWVACRPRADDQLVLSSGARSPWRGTLDQRPDSGHDWVRYVQSALHESTYTGGLDLHVESTLPLGAGLSSSAALICAVLRAVDERSNEALVAPAIRAETSGVGAPTGGMDQSISLLAQEGHALVLDFAGGRPVSLPWNPQQMGLELLVVDTGVRHDNTDGAFAAVRARSEAALRADRPLSSGEEAAGRHVHSEGLRVQAWIDAVVRGDGRRLGEVLLEGHASLRDDLGVSCPQADLVVESACSAGAWGARLTGGGFGGSVVVLTPLPLREQVLSAIAEAFDTRGWPAPRAYLGDAEGSAVRLE